MGLHEARMAQDVANLRLDIALTRESWDSVSAQLISGGAPVQSQLYALGQLYQHEQLDALRKVLPAVCPRASGDDRVGCEELQASLN